MAVYEGAEPVFPFRLKQVERELETLRAWRGRVDTTLARREEQFSNMERDLAALSKTVDSLRKVLVGFALSIAGSAVVFALSVLIATGKLGGN